MSAVTGSVLAMSTDAPALLHLVTGPEELLAERAVAAVVRSTREVDADVQLVDVTPDRYERGDLAVHTSPSLFGESKVVVLRALEDADDDLVTDAKALVGAGEPGVTLVLRHRGGSRGKGLLDAAKAAGAVVHTCAQVKSDIEKSEFVTREFRAAGRKVTPEAVRALVEAVGQDLRELASACGQLMADTVAVGGRAADAPTVDDTVVERYYGGRVEATGFKVADAAIGGQTDQALAMLRHALASGVDPVPIVAVLAMNLRSLAKVSATGSARAADIARELSMAPWQVDRARKQLRGWSGHGLGEAIEAVAAADLAVKGGLPIRGRRAGDPVYAVEKAVLAIGAARRARD